MNKVIPLFDWVYDEDVKHYKTAVAGQLGITRQYLDKVLENKEWIVEIEDNSIVDAYEVRGKVRVGRFKDD